MEDKLKDWIAFTTNCINNQYHGPVPWIPDGKEDKKREIMNKELISLGTLTQEQKEHYWKTTISGSQASKLVNEPWNLLREKLEVPSQHKSKNDIFNNNAKIQASAKSAMAQGSMYEALVLQELQTNEKYQKSNGGDITYIANYNDEDRQLLNNRITATPDFLTINEDGTLTLGEIKCSTSASDSKTMDERYRYQVLHNCYVLNIKNAILVTKNEITKPLNIYHYNFTDEDFADWEARLITFWRFVDEKNEKAYDSTAEFDEDMLNFASTEIEIDDTLEQEIDTYFRTNQQKLALDKEVKKLAASWKEKYENVSGETSQYTFKITTSYGNPKVDYKEAFHALAEQYNIPLDYLKDFESSSLTQKVDVKIRK